MESGVVAWAWFGWFAFVAGVVIGLALAAGRKRDGED